LDGSPASLPRTLRTLSCAMMTAPAAPKASLPPVWSPCRCVLITKCTGFSDSSATAERIFGTMSANWSSMMAAPSVPTVSPIVAAAAPVSM
jgi:hypothetical protein